MEAKKTPKADLEKKRRLFVQVGLILSLSITIFAFEYRTYPKGEGDIIQREVKQEVEEIIMQTKAEEPPPPPEEVPQQESTELEIVDDNQELTNEVKLENLTSTTNIRVEVPRVEVVEEKEVAEEEIFVVVEKQASFPGGQEALMKFLKENIKYPQAARETGTSGTVWVTFVVEKDGSLTDVKVAREIGSGCGAEAIRVVKLMPKWSTAQQRGKSCRQQFNLPIKFSLAG